MQNHLSRIKPKLNKKPDGPISEIIHFNAFDKKNSLLNQARHPPVSPPKKRQTNGLQKKYHLDQKISRSPQEDINAQIKLIIIKKKNQYPELALPKKGLSEKKNQFNEKSQEPHEVKS